MPELRRKLVIVGNRACGKTSLLMAFAQGRFPPAYIPTVFENYVADVRVGRKKVELALWDTADQGDDEKLRPLSYPDSHVILICFAIDSPESLDSVKETWISEVMHFCHGIPFFLIGCKKDLRDDPNTIGWPQETKQGSVLAEEGSAAAKDIGANSYLECSATTGEGVDEVFQHVTRAAILVKRKSCGGRGVQCVVV